MRRYRLGIWVTLIFLVAGFGLAGWRELHPAATPAATLASTAQAEPLSSPTQQHATPRPVVVTAIHTAEPSHKAEVIPDGLNVRNAPGGAIVGSLKQGATVTVLTVQGEWAKIGEGRYVAARYLRAK